jgi:BMFP domain-containing protein YqiC
MAQTDNPFLDGMAKAFTDAAGMAQGVRAEIDTFVRQRLERLVADMDFVPREEFEAVKAMAQKAREENEQLKARVALLEAILGDIEADVPGTRPSRPVRRAKPKRAY